MLIFTVRDLYYVSRLLLERGQARIYSQRVGLYFEMKEFALPASFGLGRVTFTSSEVAEDFGAWLSPMSRADWWRTRA